VCKKRSKFGPKLGPTHGGADASVATDNGEAAGNQQSGRRLISDGGRKEVQRRPRVSISRQVWSCRSPVTVTSQHTKSYQQPAALTAAVIELSKRETQRAALGGA
jgi:hypothetical protein